MIFRETPGVRDTAIIQTDRPVPAVITELYGRKLRGEGERAELMHLRGLKAIKEYLNAIV